MIDKAELGERLRVSRGKAGLSQEDAAKHLGVARTTIVAIEKGQRTVRGPELREFAKLYGQSLNALLRPTSLNVDLVPQFRSLKLKDFDASINSARLLSDLAAAEVELENLLGQPLRLNYPVERPLLPGDPREQGEEAALELRHRLGLGLAPIADIVTLLEMEMGVRVYVHSLPSNVSGLFAYHAKIGACILINRKHPPQRRALTAAHELGHLVGSRDQPEVLEGVDGSATARDEKFANAFAFSFLMPAPLVRNRFKDLAGKGRKFSPRHLIIFAHSLHVSEEALCRRLEELSLLPRGTWESLHDRGFSGKLVREVLGDQAKVDVRLSMPPRLWLLAVEASRQGLLTEGQIADLLKIDHIEVRELLDFIGDIEFLNDDDIQSE